MAKPTAKQLDLDAKRSRGLGPTIIAKHPASGPVRTAKAWAELDAYLLRHPEETEVLTRSTEHFFGPRP